MFFYSKKFLFNFVQDYFCLPTEKKNCTKRCTYQIKFELRDYWLQIRKQIYTIEPYINI